MSLEHQDPEGKAIGDNRQHSEWGMCEFDNLPGSDDNCTLDWCDRNIALKWQTPQYDLGPGSF